MRLFKKIKSDTYFDLSLSDRKKIVKSAVREANIEQLSLVMGRDRKMAEYCEQT